MGSKIYKKKKKLDGLKQLSQNLWGKTICKEILDGKIIISHFFNEIKKDH